MDLFSTDTLLAIVRDLRVPASGLAARYFTSIATDESEEIHFDVDNKPRRMSAFVSPVVQGKVVKSRGYSTTTFKPAYIKDKRVFTPNRALKRAMGESLGGGDLTPAARMEILVAMDLLDQMEMVERRLEWMAAQILYNGSVTIEGDDYPKVVVDFGRHADLTKVLGSGSKWGEANVKPLDDLQDWSTDMLQRSGVGIKDVIMTVDVWKVFRVDADVKDRIDRRFAPAQLKQDAMAQEGLLWLGNVDGFDIWTYAGWVVDPKTNAEGSLLPAGTVICTGSPETVDGVRHYGAIQDHGSLVAEPYYAKSWLEEDPSVRYLLMQSAPLLVPYRVNATMRAKVK